MHGAWEERGKSEKTQFQINLRDISPKVLCPVRYTHLQLQSTRQASNILLG